LTDQPLLELRGITKTFGSVQALSDVDFEVRSGEVMALVGDNGAGKSTLIKILSGVHPPDKGEIFLEGQRIAIRNPKHAMRLGIETIYQYNSMVPTMSIARNLFVGREPLKCGIGGFGIMDQKRMRQESVQAIADVELHGLLRVADVDALPFDEDLALVGAVDAGKDLDQRRLAGAVVADQPDRFALGDSQVHALQGVNAGVPFMQAATLDDGPVHCPPVP